MLLITVQIMRAMGDKLVMTWALGMLPIYKQLGPQATCL